MQVVGSNLVYKIEFTYLSCDRPIIFLEFCGNYLNALRLFRKMTLRWGILAGSISSTSVMMLWPPSIKGQADRVGGNWDMMITGFIT